MNQKPLVALKPFVCTPDRTDAPFVTHAQLSLDRGWFPFPLEGKGGKHKTPVGVTGNSGVVDADKVRKFLISYPTGFDNIAYRHEGTMAIDVDVNDGTNGKEAKTGDAHLKAFADKHGLPELPPTYSSTARGPESPSRQYFFRIPDAFTRFNNPITDVDICQRSHRYSVVAPSIHPDTGTRYEWYEKGSGGQTWGAATSEVPDVDDLAELPGEWLSALQSGALADLDYSADVSSAEELLSTFVEGEPSKPVRAAMDRARSQHMGHPATTSALLTALMYGREGHPGARQLVELIVGLHNDYLKSDHPERVGEAEDLLNAMAVTAQQKPIDEASRYRPDGELFSIGSTSASVPTAEETADFLLPAEIWSRTPVMEHIYQAALAEMVSPDALLHAVMAKVAAYQHHMSRLHTGKGMSGFNYFFAPVAASGGGKTVAMHTADKLLDDWCRGMTVTLPGTPKNSPLGSGEGIQEAFMATVLAQELAEDGTPLVDDDGKPIYSKQKVKKQVTHNVLFSTDEGRTALKIEERAGATLFPTLCSMWSSSSLGAANAKEETSRSLDAYSYSVGLILGFQIDTIDALFDDKAGGAPQRFAFAPTEYAPYETMTELDEQDIEWPGSLKPLSLNMAVDVHLNDSAKMEVRKHRRLTASGKHKALGLNGHAMLLRCRMAGLIALLHGERVVSDEVWALSKVMLDASCAYRDWLSGIGARKAMDVLAARTQNGINASVQSSAKSREQQKVEEAADLLIDRLPDEGETEGRARNKLPRTMHGDIAKAAVEYAISTGRLKRVDVQDGKRVTSWLHHTSVLEEAA